MRPLIIFLLFITGTAFGQGLVSKKVIESSRGSSVRIISKLGNIGGTGFYISDDIIATCFHVISRVTVDSLNKANFTIFNDLQAINEDGESISLTCISIPDDNSPEPLLQDFALLRTSKILSNKSILPLAKTFSIHIADNVIFSGYPLGTPTMVSHFGLISGITKDRSIFSIQSPTNKGNSGGALMDKEGRVIGIISMREGGISMGLQNYLKKLSASDKQGSLTIMGIDPLQATKETITVLDTYISTGIGYARSIHFLNDYIQKKNIKL